MKKGFVTLGPDWQPGQVLHSSPLHQRLEQTVMVKKTVSV